MPKDDVDLTIEALFGFSIGEDKPDKETTPPPKPASEEEDLDVDALLSGGPKKPSRRLSKKEMEKLLTGGTHKPKKTPSKPPEPRTVPKSSEEAGTPLDAAQAVREAVVAHEGKRRSVDSWKDIARDVLQLGRLPKKRWDEVIQVGVDAGLFKVDETTLSYPHLIPLDPETEKPRQDLPTRPPTVNREPKNSNPPRILPCGHVDFLRDPEHEQHVAAREEGRCCAYARDGSRSGYTRIWTAVKEPHLSTLKVPEDQRRDWNKAGFPGYCTDEDGRYIGGVYNDCRYHTEPDKPETPIYHPREEWCSACHARYSE